MKKYIPLLVIAVIGVIAIIFFFYHFGHNDDKVLTEFSSAYQKYDRAFSDFSIAAYMSDFEGTPRYDDLAQITDQALDELSIKSSARISSLTRYDAEIMNLMQEIAELSGQDLVALKTYQSAMANKDPRLDQFTSEVQDLTVKRQAAYARFHELSGY